MKSHNSLRSRRLLLLVCLLSWTCEAEQVVISKIMYHPSRGLPEYIEICNNTATPFDIANWQLTAGVHYEFPAFSTNDPDATFLKPFERIVLCGERAKTVRAAYGIPETVRLYGPWRGKLNNQGERITLQDKNGIALCTVKYGASGHWPLAANGAGQALVLKDPNKTVDDWRNWTASESRGGSRGWAPAPAKKPASGKTPLDGTTVRNGDIVINEIMYDPPSMLTNASQFIELYNRGKASADLSGWQLEDGVRFKFPRGTKIPAGGYLVIAANMNQLREAYGNIPMLGNFQGKLSHHGELIRLVDRAGNLVNQVDYKSGGDWPEWAAGGGSSMELINPWMDNSLASAWRDSDESRKAPMREYSFSANYEELHTKGAPSDYKELHLHLVGESHLVLSDIWFGRKGAATNYILNGTTLSEDGFSAKGWLCQGNHSASYITNGLFHLIADGRGDNRANRVEIDVTNMHKGDTCELKFKGRWICGKPRLIAQTWDHSIANSFAIEVPRNLGTPGAANSCCTAIGSGAGVPPASPGVSPAKEQGKGIAGAGETPAPLSAGWKPAPLSLTPAAAPPQVDSVLHTPAVPHSTNAVKVTARVFSASPLESVKVFYRRDNAKGDGVWTNGLMNDLGTNGDALAGDGLWTAEIPPKWNSQIIQFYVLATAANGQTCLLPREGAERPASYVVDNRPVPRDLRTVRFIVSAYDLGAMANGNTAKYGFKYPRHSNRYFNCTFISNEQEVFYNAQVRNSGSPWTRGGGLDRPKLKLPNDRRFRSHDHLDYDNDPANGNFHNRVTRYWLYLMGHPVCESEIVRMVVNQGGIDLREETEPVHQDFLNRNFPHGSHGQLYRIDDEWWFADNWERDQRDADWTYKGSDNPGRYRTEWMKRTGEAEDDFTSLIGFFKLVSSRQYSQSEIEKFLDPHAVLKYAAVRGYTADWDSFTMTRGKNGFFYQRPTDGLFQFLQWDSDLAFGDANSGFYSRIAPWLEKPYNRRLFHYYLAELHENYTKGSARLQAWLQAEEDASNAYSTKPSFYLNWCTNREAAVLRELGKDYTVPFRINPVNASNTVTAAVVTLSGTAPCTIFALELDGSSARPQWKRSAEWNFPDLPLPAKENRFVVKALREDGSVSDRASLTVTRVAPR